MPTPLKRQRKVKKHPQGWKRYHSDRYKRVKTSWRRPRGIDSVVRRKFRGYMRLPGIGYRTDRKTRDLLPNGFYRFRVFNVEELELLLMHNRKYAAEIASTVSIRKRKQILERAQQLDIRVINRNAKLRTEEDE